MISIVAPAALLGLFAGVIFRFANLYEITNPEDNKSRSDISLPLSARLSPANIFSRPDIRRLLVMSSLAAWGMMFSLNTDKLRADCAMAVILSCGFLFGLRFAILTTLISGFGISIFSPANMDAILFGRALIGSLASGWLGKKSLLKNSSISPKKGALWSLLIGTLLSGGVSSPLGSGIIISFSVFAFMSIVALHADRYESDVQRERELRANARFELLRSQINPHFLFNALNTIASTVRRDQELARSLILDLSDFLRNSLNKRDRLIPLHEEVNLTRKWTAIQSARFGSKLNVSFDVSENCNNLLIPPLCLQPLLENSVKYGLSDREAPLNIRVKARKFDHVFCIRVTDDGTGWPEGTVTGIFQGNHKNYSREKKPSYSEETIFHKWSSPVISNGIGLVNVAERLELIFKGKAYLKTGRPESDPSGAWVEICLPSESSESFESETIVEERSENAR